MGRIVVDEERCKGCELCAAFCPPRVIVMADHYNSRGYRPATLEENSSRCTGCALCARMCPDAAIIVYR